jgi:hypothetical protein
LEKVPEFSGEETGEAQLPPKSFIRNLKGIFDTKGTPTSLHVKLTVPLLRGKALAAFNAFTNAAGDTGDRTTTNWNEFEKLIHSLQPDELVESQYIEKAYEGLSQKGSASKFVEAYRSSVAKIKANAESKGLHTDASLIRKFTMKLKPGVQVHLMDKAFASLEDVYSAAIRADDLVFAASRPPSTPSPARPRAPPSAGTLTPYGSRAPSPMPPAQLSALLAALGYDLPSAQSNALGMAQVPMDLAAVERSHAVLPGAPVPQMTPEIKAWCVKNNACFRCREPNMAKTHTTRGVCPRFGPSLPRRLNALEEESLGSSTASQGND